MGRLGGLSAAMSNIADKLKNDREAKQKRSPLDILIEQSKGVEAAGILGRTDIARAIRAASGGQPASVPAGQVTSAATPGNLLGTAPAATIGDPGVNAPQGKSGDLLFKKFKEETNVFGETTRQPTEIISKKALISEKIAGEATKAVGKQLESFLLIKIRYFVQQ